MHGKAGKAEAVLVQLHREVFFHQSRNFGHNLCGQDGGVHVAYLGFRRDEVHCNTHSFLVGQLNVQSIPELVQGLLCKAVFLRVQVPDIIGKRCLEDNAVPAALNGKVQVVGQRVGQVRAQGTVQLVLCVGGDIATRNTSPGISRSSSKYFSFTS